MKRIEVGRNGEVDGGQDMEERGRVQRAISEAIPGADVRGRPEARQRHRSVAVRLDRSMAAVDDHAPALASLHAMRQRWGVPWNHSLARSKAVKSDRARLHAAAGLLEQELSVAEIQLEAQHSSTPPQRRWHFNRVIPCILLLAILEVPAAYLSAQAFDVSLNLTIVLTLLIVAALIIAAGGLAHSAGRQRDAVVWGATVALALLAALRGRYLLAFDATLAGAVLGALGMTVLSLAVFWLAHELVRRTEPLSMYRARKSVEGARRRVTRAREAVANAHREVARSTAECMTFVDRHAEEVASESGEPAGRQVRAQLTRWLES
jgi:hypothetical protein